MYSNLQYSTNINIRICYVKKAVNAGVVKTAGS